MSSEEPVMESKKLIQRRELKFLIHHSTYELLHQRWSGHLMSDSHMEKYGMCSILSQYYDSPELHFYQEKLAGIGLRHKVRLRTYGRHFSQGQTSFLEIKYRHFDFVHKLRHQEKFEPRLFDPLHWNTGDKRMQSALMGLNEKYRLRPTAQVYYQREAYNGLAEKDLRITFDSNVIGLHPEEILSRDIMNNPKRRLLPETCIILEIKSNGVLPHWVQQGIVAYELEQKTIPKYVTAVEVLNLVTMNASGVYT